MRGVYCYLPILPARGGAFRAVAKLSPLARSRLIPLFDVPLRVPKNNETLEDYLTKRVEGIHAAWGRGRPVYVDVHDLALDLRTSSDAAPITFLFDLLRMYSMSAIPVTGTESERDRNYLHAIRAIIARDQRGACLRLTEDDFSDPQILRTSVVGVLEALAVGPPELDVVLDFRHVGKRSVDVLRATAHDAFEAINNVGPFRNIVIAGSSVPDVLGKRDHGKIRRESRVELDLWIQLMTALSDRVPIAFSDYGIVGAHYVPPGKPVNVPARIRYTTTREHVYYRANHNEYPGICEQLIESTDFLDKNFSAGDRSIHKCANGTVGPGAPMDWVANDTNHHLEFVSEQIWRHLNESRLNSLFALPEPEHLPWLQGELV